jgi:hypothetical protein
MRGEAVQPSAWRSPPRERGCHVRSGRYPAWFESSSDHVSALPERNNTQLARQYYFVLDGSVHELWPEVSDRAE